MNSETLTALFDRMATPLARVQGRQFPLHVLEPVEDLVFDNDEALVEAIVQLLISAAALDMVSTLVFVRGKGMVERIADVIRGKCK